MDEVDSLRGDRRRLVDAMGLVVEKKEMMLEGNTVRGGMEADSSGSDRTYFIERG